MRTMKVVVEAARTAFDEIVGRATLLEAENETLKATVRDLAAQRDKLQRAHDRALAVVAEHERRIR